MKLSDDITYLKGVGAKRAQMLSKLNIRTVGDLLYFFPRKYEDRRKVSYIIEAPFDEDVLLEVNVVSIHTQSPSFMKKVPLKVLCEDDTGRLELVFFNAKYLRSFFKSGQKLTLFGKISFNSGRRQMIHPEFHITGEKDDIRGILPVYPLTEGVSQLQLRNLMIQARTCVNQIVEWIPDWIVDENNLCPPSYAVDNLHFASEERKILEGRYRLIFEELLVLQTGLFYIRHGKKNDKHGVKLNSEISADSFISSIPFELTEGQKKAYMEIEKDLEADIPMNRLLQGDVGSGKTIVAETAMYKTVKSGYQACMMAPTELLAKQHFENIKRDFEPFRITCAHLTGNMKTTEREILKKALKEGKIDILVGTHAIIQPDIEFKELGLVITDEQHRFGVNQRNLLESKGKAPNVLVMTATPIPRTLSVIMFGDLDSSVIDTLPEGRLPVRTFLRYGESREKIYDFVETKVKEGRQAYVVAPLIEESESLDLKSATEIYEELKAKYRNINFGLLHGGMKQAEKDETMTNFKDNKIDVLVSTVVIEVGIDVPNASVMVIENSERFGLAQLHQLRGRVGRGDAQSYCILISGSKSEIAEKRNRILVSTADGFEIAEEDLKLRGPGEIFGTRQHGLPELNVADLLKNTEVLKTVSKTAEKLISEDPALKSIENIELKERVKRMFGDSISLKL